MAIALDYTARIDPAELHAADVTQVCRYLSWLYYWGGTSHNYVNPKIIQRAEYDELRAAGIEVTLNWEFDEHDWLTGADGGSAHALEAVTQARKLGHPSTWVIVGSADFDMTRGQWDSAGREYGAAFRNVIRAGGYRPGVYGPWDVLTWCRDELGYDAFWQAAMSTAWSGGRNGRAWPGAHLCQRGYRTVAGIQADWNEILIPAWGGTEEDFMASADEILRLLRNIEGIVTRQSQDWDDLPSGVYPDGSPIVEGGSVPNVTKQRLVELLAKVDGVTAGAAPTQEQVNAAVLAALQDPAVVAGIGAALASHLHVS